jgi:GGDEF domain-containing protein
LAAGWPFPSDWALAEVDLVCAAAHDGTELAEALAELGRARAEAGAGLNETLQDLAALHAVLTMPDDHDGVVSADPDAPPAKLLRVVALAWADVMVRQLAHDEVRDGLTGLSNLAYLRARLREIYRAAGVTGVPPQAGHVLVVVAPDLSRIAGWSRLAAMVLLADVLRAVFDGGQTLASVGKSAIAVLAERDGRLSERVARTRWLAAARLELDPQLRGIAPPAIWLERLPATHQAACRLLADLAPV